MQKALFSSPAAALDSTRRRIALLESKPLNAAETAEVASLNEFASALERIGTPHFSKFQQLVARLKSPAFAWNPADPSDRLVVFSERIETLRWLEEALPKAVGLKPAQFEILHGGMSDTEQQALVDRFGRREDTVRVLLCSDVASEGLNLHYFCHRLVHFDLPWSLMVFQQRNGRVDRYGQAREPRIVYLFTETTVERIKGDLRILEILQTKDEQAHKNLGDPACFLRLHDPEKEALKVAEVMAAGTTPEVFNQTLDQNQAATSPTGDAEEGDVDWLLALFAQTEPVAPTPPASINAVHHALSLFGDRQLSSDYAFAQTALRQLNPIPQFFADDEAQTLTLTAPADLQERLRISLPSEVRDEHHSYTLCADPARVATAIEHARQARAEEDTWPALHYLWPQQPILEWLSDRVLSPFGRQQAPVLQLPALAEGEHAFLLMGLIPNKKGQPLLIEWQVAVLHGAHWRLEAFPHFVARTGLKAGVLANPAAPMDTLSLQNALPAAVDAMSQHMVGLQEKFSAAMHSRLADTLQNLATLQSAQIEQLELRLAANKQDEVFKKGRREKRTQQIRHVFDEYRQWVEDTMTTEPQPFLQVLAAAKR